jgi:hypothetical protein
MPERMRSTFDEVVDVSKKLMAETAQLKLTDGRDPIPGYEPRVGSIPDALAITPKFTSLADASKAYVQNAFDKVKNDPVATWDKISKFGTGWMDAQEVKLRSDHWLNGNASKWEQARELGNNVTNRLGQMVKPWRATEHAFAQANPQEHATLNNLRADANQQGYDFRKWSRDQDPLVMKSIADLAPEKAAALNARIDQAKQLWNNIAGVAKPTDDLYRANAQAAHFVKLNLVADAVYRNKYADRNLPAFALDPVQEIAQHAEMIEDAGAVAAYGRKTLNDRLTQLEKLGAAHAPDVEAMRLRETDLVNKIKDLMTSGADKDAISAARDEALKTHDEVQSLVGEQRDITQFVKSQRDAIAQADAVPYSHFGRDGEHFVGMKLATNPDGSLNPKAADRLKSLLVEAGHDNLVIDRDNENNEFFARVADATQRDSLARIAKTLSNEKLLADDVKNDKGVVTEPAFRQGEADGVNAQQFRGSAPAAVEKLLSRLSADHADLPDDVHKDLMGKLRGVYLDMLPKNSMVRLFEPRQGIMGYHQDMTASFDQYMSQFANAAGRMWSQPHILDALSGMRKSVDGLQTDLNAPKGAVDVATAFAREIMQRETGSPARARNGLMRNALAVNHMYYLGLSLSYMTELLTQIPTLLLPQLGRKFGYMPSAVAIANAVIPAAKVVRALMASGHGADGMLTPEALRNARLSDEHVKVATQTANRDKLELGGWTHATLSDAPSLAKSRMVQRMNALTVASEVFPRAMAMFAAHDLHSSEGGAAKARMGLNDYIDETIGQSMYNWQTDLQARHLGAGGFAGQITPLVTKFMSFQTKMINRLVREVNSAYGPLSRQQAEHDAARIPGADVDKLTKQYQSESRKFLAGHLAAVTTLSGTLGLPVAGVAASAASTLANFLGGTDKYDAETWYREHLNNVFGPQIGEAIAKGLPRLAGMDLSEHAGEDRLLPFSDMLTDKRKWSDVFSSAAWHSLGSPFSMAANMVKGATDVANGRMLKGVQEVLPSSAKNVFSAWRMSQYGYEDNRGVKLPMQAPGAGDILMQAVGITPQPLAHEREATEALQGLKDRRSIVTSNLSANLVTAMSHHDNDAMQAALRSYQAFDADHPGAFADPTKDISKAYAEQNRGKAFGVLDLNPRDLDQMRTIRAYGMLRSP